MKLQSLLLLGVSVVGITSVAGYSLLSNAAQHGLENTPTAQAMQTSNRR